MVQVFKTILDGICNLEPMPHSSTQKNIMNPVCVCSKYRLCSGSTFDGCFVFRVLIKLEGERLALGNRNAVLALTDTQA